MTHVKAWPQPPARICQVSEPGDGVCARRGGGAEHTGHVGDLHVDGVEALCDDVSETGVRDLRHGLGGCSYVEGGLVEDVVEKMRSIR